MIVRGSDNIQLYINFIVEFEKLIKISREINSILNAYSSAVIFASFPRPYLIMPERSSRKNLSI